MNVGESSQQRLQAQSVGAAGVALLRELAVIPETPRVAGSTHTGASYAQQHGHAALMATKEAAPEQPPAAPPAGEPHDDAGRSATSRHTVVSRCRHRCSQVRDFPQIEPQISLRNYSGRLCTLDAYHP